LCWFQITFLLLLNRVITCQEAREREATPGYMYHIVLRGINKQPIFEDEVDCLPTDISLAADLCSFYLPNTNTEGQRLCDNIGASMYHVTKVEIGECDA
jgi:hypothetical protein